MALADRTTVPQLAFAVRDAGAAEHAAVPTVRFALEIEAERPIRSVLLDAQVQIAARLRPYDTAEHDGLLELFGTPDRWGTTLRTLPWIRTTLVVPPFSGRTLVDLAVVCTYDLEVTASRYLSALADGEVPLEFLFSGSVFYAGEDGGLQVGRIPLDREAQYPMPVRVWREAMDRHFPDSAWVRLGRDSFDRLRSYRAREGLAGWDEAVDALLARRGEE